MFVPTTFAIALTMILISTACWGSGQQLQTDEELRLELFY
jgi:hypothetical protein